MNFLLFFEYSPEDQKKISDGDAMLRAEREKHPEKYPQYVTDMYLLGGDLPRLTESVKGVAVIDVENPRQLADDQAYWLGLQHDAKTWKTWLVPLTEVNEAFVAEALRMQHILDERKSETTR